MPRFHADEAEEQPGGGQREGHRKAGEEEQQQAAEHQRHEVLGDEFHQRTSSWTWAACSSISWPISSLASVSMWLMTSGPAPLMKAALDQFGQPCSRPAE
jgi:hypothetical protein